MTALEGSLFVLWHPWRWRAFFLQPVRGLCSLANEDLSCLSLAMLQLCVSFAG